MDKVFQRLKQANITIRPTKCSLGPTKMVFIGQVMSQGVITPNEDNIKKVREAAEPRTKKEVQSFLGLTAYYRNYIPNYSAIASPLTDLKRKRLPNKIKWSEP